LSCDLSLKNHDKIAAETALTSAVRSGNIEIVALILKVERSLEGYKLDNKHPLLVACELGYDEIVSLLLTVGPHLHDNPIHYVLEAIVGSVISSTPEIVSLLLAAGARVNPSAECLVDPIFAITRMVRYVGILDLISISILDRYLHGVDNLSVWHY